MTLVSKSAQTVQDTLSKAGVNSKVVELASTTRTAADAAQTIGCQIAQIVKSLIFKVTLSQEPILVLASGANRVNEKSIEQLIGKKIEKADADFTRAVTGFAIGGIPPIGLEQTIRTFIDEDLLSFKEVWAAAGTPHAVFSIDPLILKKLTDGTTISIK